MNLKSLVVSSQAIAEDKLAELLNGKFSIVENTGEVIPLSPVKKMELPAQILLFLLAARAAEILKYRADAAASPDEIAASLGLDLNRTREALSRLKRDWLTKTNKGYEVPIPRTMSVMDEIKNKN